MSWDVLICKFACHYESVSDIPHDEKGVVIGPRESIHSAVSAVFPNTDWRDPSWGVWDSEFGSIEFNVSNDPVTSMTLHVRAGPGVIPGIVQLCRDNGWQGIDLGSPDEFIEQSSNPEKGLQAWAAYRDRSIGARPVDDS